MPLANALADREMCYNVKKKSLSLLPGLVDMFPRKTRSVSLHGKLLPHPHPSPCVPSDIPSHSLQSVYVLLFTLDLAELL